MAWALRFESKILVAILRSHILAADSKLPRSVGSRDQTNESGGVNFTILQLHDDANLLDMGFGDSLFGF